MCYGNVLSNHSLPTQMHNAETEETFHAIGHRSTGWSRMNSEPRMSHERRVWSLTFKFSLDGSKVALRIYSPVTSRRNLLHMLESPPNTGRQWLGIRYLDDFKRRPSTGDLRVRIRACRSFTAGASREPELNMSSRGGRMQGCLSKPCLTC